MDKFKLILLLIPFCSIPFLAYGQSYGGGVGDGYDIGISAESSGGTSSFYGGGSDDGYDSEESPSFSGTFDKFFGGAGDGYASIETMAFSFTPAKFQGSAGDGYAAALSPLVKSASKYTQAITSTPAMQESELQDKVANADQSETLIFPNPFQDILHVKTSSESETVLVEIVDMLGKRVYAADHSSEGNGQEMVLDLSNLSGGTYILTIVLKNGEKTILLKERIIRATMK